MSYSLIFLLRLDEVVDEVLAVSFSLSLFSELLPENEELSELLDEWVENEREEVEFDELFVSEDDEVDEDSWSRFSVSFLLRTDSNI